MYDHYVRENFGLRKISEIKYSDVTYFYNYLLNTEGLQPNTVDTIHTVLHPTFQLAVRDEIIRTNPSDGVMAEIKRKAGKNKGVRHALTIEQQRAFMNYTANSPVYSHWKPLFTVLLGTGCRIGEVIGLRWEDIDLDKRTISINHSVTYYAREGSKTRKSEFAVSLPKTEAGKRTIPMMDAVYEAFKEEYEAQKENGFNCTEIDGMTGFIFCNRFGNINNPQTINRTIKRIRESYNAEEEINAKKEKRQPVIIPHFSCHHLRHTFCTRFCEKETNIKVIQAVMGHADIATTMDIYAEVTDAKKKEAIENLSHNLDIF
jgi:integrase